MRGLLTATLALCVSVATGCASVINGSHQNVEIRTTPSGARALILPDQETVETPAVVVLDRARARTVRLEKEGHCPAIVPVDRLGSKWIYGNLVLGGLIGFTLDTTGGGAFVLTPDPMVVPLRPAADGCGATR